MILFAVIFIAAAAFLIGFLMGVKKEPPIKLEKQVTKPDEETAVIRQEYENFLNYDGSVQQ